MPHRHPGTEIELKLRVAPEAIRRLAAHRLLRGREHPVTRRLQSVYYDTPALDLLRQGIALRVRKEGGAWVQTVKGGSTVRAGLHERAESEARVAGPGPDLARVEDRAFAAALQRPRIRDELRPVFVTDFRRSRRVLEPGGGTTIEASIDRGVIRSGEQVEPLAELELELKSGNSAQLYELALKLQKDVPLALESRSKSARGYALQGAAQETPVKARAAVLDPGMTVSDAFKAVMWANLAHLHANERGILEGADPEFLHQMRVALRRLRSALGVFSPPVPEAETEPLARDLKWLASSLGPARDWDVFLAETLPPIEAEFGAHGELRAFGARCRKLRREANARARRAVRSSRYQRLLLRLAGWIAAEGWRASPLAPAGDAIQRPVTELAARVLEKRYQQARRRGRGLAKRSPAELHRLRIAIKKFRYATDFFASLYEGRTARESLKRLGRLQDILGAMNDAATVTGLLTQGFGGARGKRVLEARGILLGWSRGRAVILKQELKGAWKAFRDTERFW
ncbi:MAG: CHAD domain-containing protein [Betaproteobacteria bacterium]|nr:CHAD domain-containing protein [Betaproteobacteria bacterium]MDH3437237.1 CHAD domain-containing protein [Betaproteobacteria bacterium]